MDSAFLWQNLVDVGTISTGYTTLPVASLPLSHLVDPQLRVRARWQATAATLQVDLVTAQEVSCLAVLGTNIPASGATVRWRAAGNALMSAPQYDSGTIDAETAPAANGNVVLVHPTSVTTRYHRLDISVPAAETIDVGRFVVGPLWRLGAGPAFGMEEGRALLDRRDRNPITGAEFPVAALANPRLATFTLPIISDAEARGEFRSMLATLGAVGDALWIPDTGLDQDELNLRSVWGAIAPPGGTASLALRLNDVHQRSFTLVERL